MKRLKKKLIEEYGDKWCILSYKDKRACCDREVGYINTRAVSRCEACLHRVSDDIGLCRLCCGVHNGYMCARIPPGNDINSRKKHEEEVMYITHEHNRLDQSNLGFILCAFLFEANKAVTYLGNDDVDAAIVDRGVFTHWFRILRWQNKTISIMNSLINQKYNVVSNEYAVIVFFFL